MFDFNDPSLVVQMCKFEAFIQKSHIVIKFPCSYFVEWKTINNRYSICTQKRVRTANDEAIFNQKLTFYTEMVFNSKKKEYYSKETFLVLNLVSKSRPDQVKLVGRVSVDLADVLNHKRYNQPTVMRLNYCSVQGSISFSVLLLNKRDSNLSVRDLDRSAFTDYFSLNPINSRGIIGEESIGGEGNGNVKRNDGLLRGQGVNVTGSNNSNNRVPVFGSGDFTAREKNGMVNNSSISRRPSRSGEQHQHSQRSQLQSQQQQLRHQENTNRNQSLRKQQQQQQQFMTIKQQYDDQLMSFRNSQQKKSNGGEENNNNNYSSHNQHQHRTTRTESREQSLIERLEERNFNNGVGVLNNSINNNNNQVDAARLLWLSREKQTESKNKVEVSHTESLTDRDNNNYDKGTVNINGGIVVSHSNQRKAAKQTGRGVGSANIRSRTQVRHVGWSRNDDNENQGYLPRANANLAGQITSHQQQFQIVNSNKISVSKQTHQNTQNIITQNLNNIRSQQNLSQSSQYCQNNNKLLSIVENLQREKQQQETTIKELKSMLIGGGFGMKKAKNKANGGTDEQVGVKQSSGEQCNSQLKQQNTKLKSQNTILKQQIASLRLEITSKQQLISQLQQQHQARTQQSSNKIQQLNGELNRSQEQLMRRQKQYKQTVRELESKYEESRRLQEEYKVMCESMRLSLSQHQERILELTNSASNNYNYNSNNNNKQNVIQLPKQQQTLQHNTHQAIQHNERQQQYSQQSIVLTNQHNQQQQTEPELFTIKITKDENIYQQLEKENAELVERVKELQQENDIYKGLLREFNAKVYDRGQGEGVVRDNGSNKNRPGFNNNIEGKSITNQDELQVLLCHTRYQLNVSAIQQDDQHNKSSYLQQQSKQLPQHSLQQQQPLQLDSNQPIRITISKNNNIYDNYENLQKENEELCKHIQFLQEELESYKQLLKEHNYPEEGNLNGQLGNKKRSSIYEGVAEIVQSGNQKEVYGHLNQEGEKKDNGTIYIREGEKKIKNEGNQLLKNMLSSLHGSLNGSVVQERDQQQHKQKQSAILEKITKIFPHNISQQSLPSQQLRESFKIIVTKDKQIYEQQQEENKELSKRVIELEEQIEKYRELLNGHSGEEQCHNSGVYNVAISNGSAAKHVSSGCSNQHHTPTTQPQSTSRSNNRRNSTVNSRSSIQRQQQYHQQNITIRLTKDNNIFQNQQAQLQQLNRNLIELQEKLQQKQQQLKKYIRQYGEIKPVYHDKEYRISITRQEDIYQSQEEEIKQLLVTIQSKDVEIVWLIEKVNRLQETIAALSNHKGGQGSRQDISNSIVEYSLNNISSSMTKAQQQQQHYHQQQQPQQPPAFKINIHRQQNIYQQQQQELRQLSQRVLELEAELQNKIEIIKQKDAEIDQIQKQLLSLGSELERVAKGHQSERVITAARLDNQHKQQQHQLIQQLRRTFQQQKLTLQQKLAQLQTTNTILEQQKGLLEQQIATLQQQKFCLNSTENQLKIKIGELQQEVYQLALENEKLSEELVFVQENYQLREINGRDGNNCQQRNDYHHLQYEGETIIAGFYKHNAQGVSRQQQQQKQQVTISHKAQTPISNDNDFLQISQLQSQNTHLTEQISSLKQSLTLFQQQLQQQQLTIGELQQRVSRLMHQKQILIQERDNLSRTKQLFRKQLEEKKQKLIKREKEWEDKERQMIIKIDGLEKDIKRISTEREELNRQNSHNKTIEKQKQQQYQEHISRLVKQKQDSLNKMQETHRLVVDNKTAHIESLLVEIQSQRELADQINKKYQQLSKDYQQLLLTVETNQNELHNQHADMKSLKETKIMQNLSQLIEELRLSHQGKEHLIEELLVFVKNTQEEQNNKEQQREEKLSKLIIKEIQRVKLALMKDTNKLLLQQQQKQGQSTKGLINGPLQRSNQRQLYFTNNNNSNGVNASKNTMNTEESKLMKVFLSYLKPIEDLVNTY